jgi:hypothetical protein
MHGVGFYLKNVRMAKIGEKQNASVETEAFS